MKFRLNIIENASRNKAIHLLYLVFLLLIFSFMPFSQHNAVHSVDLDLESSANSLDNLNNTATLLFLHLLKNEPELFEELKYQSLEIEQLASYPLSYISSLELQIVNSKAEQKVLNRTDGYTGISKEQADSLIRKLRIFKKSLAEMTDFSTAEEFDRILPLKDYVKTDRENLVPITDFYFPSNLSSELAINHLSSFKLSIIRIKSLAVRSLIRQTSFKGTGLSAFESIKLNEDEQLADILTSESIYDFFNRLNRVNFGVSGDTVSRHSFYVEKRSAAQMTLGQFMDYHIQFTANDDLPFVVRVSSAGSKAVFTLPGSGDFIYYPETAGVYQIKFEQGNESYTEQIRVIKGNTVISNAGLPSMFANIENEIPINPVITDRKIPIDLSISRGTVVQRNEQFFALIPGAGTAELEVYAQMPYGRILVNRTKYRISATPAIRLQFRNYASGSVIGSTELAAFSNVQLISDLDLGETQLKDFQLILLSGSDQKMSNPVNNYGEVLNASARQLLSSAKPGDMLLLSRIHVKSPGGSTTEIAPYTVYIR